MMLSGLNPKEESMVDNDNGYNGDEIKAESFLDKYDLNKKCTGAYVTNILKKKATKSQKVSNVVQMNKKEKNITLCIL